MEATLFNFRGRSDGKWIYSTGMSRGPEGNDAVLLNYQYSKPLEMKKIDKGSLSVSLGYMDKNRRMIYEGDIIQVNGTVRKVIKYNNRLHSIAQVSLREYLAFNEKDPEWLDKLWIVVGNDWWKEFEDSIEVIGDIYDIDKFK